MRRPYTWFRDVPMWATFDFIDDNNPHLNTFFHRCEKVGKTLYRDIDKSRVGMRDIHAVGTVMVKVYHVGPPLD